MSERSERSVTARSERSEDFELMRTPPKAAHS